MSLYGALFSGVSGLSAQGSAIAAIGDNVSNINTIGYKASSIDFSTLVTNGNTSTGYTSGGVQAGTRRLIDEQGLIQGTGVSTDLAVSGEGFFVVNTKSDASGEFLYTRAGSFRKDSRGNFVNAAGFNLMAWPLDGESRLPGEGKNLNTTSSALLDSLEPVNVKAVSGVASSTTRVSVGANLNASERVLKGAGDTIDIPSTAVDNAAINADNIIVPDGGVNPLQLSENNSITLTATPPGTPYTYTFGGMVASNDITANPVYNAITPSMVFSILPAVGGATAGSKFTITTVATGAVTFTLSANSPNVSLGQFNSLNTLADAINQVQGLTARVAHNQLYIAPKDATQAMTLADVVGNFTTTLGGTVSTGTAAVANRFATLNGLSSLISASNGLGANVINPLGLSTMDMYTVDPLGTMSITASKNSLLNNNPMTTGAAASNVVTVTHLGHGFTTGDYVNITGAAAFDGVTVAAGNYQVTVVDGDHYTIVASAGTATAGNVSGGGGSVVEIAGLGNNPLSTTLASTTVTVTDTNHGFVTGDSVTIAGSAAVGGLSLDGAYKITVVDANTYTITAASAATATAVGGGAAVTVDRGIKVLKEFGLKTTGLPPTSTALGPAYDPTDGTVVPNMAAGGVTPHFSRNVRMFDALGVGHDFQISFLKTSDNTWSVEVYAINPDEIVASRTDGQILTGNIIFNGDGSLRSLSPTLTAPVTIVWANKAVPNEVNFNWGSQGQLASSATTGSVGKTDGLRQFSSPYDVQFLEQNGVAPGLLTSLNIDEEGFVVANFSNGELRKLFKVPLATFANSNGLTPLVGNVSAKAKILGVLTCALPHLEGPEKISPAALEQANVELADELTKMLVAQRGYQASSKVIRTADNLLEELNQVFSR